MNEAAEAELRKKNRLGGLTLKLGDLEQVDVEKMKGVFKNLHPPENLEELEIMGYPGLQFPSWNTSGSNLASLKLHGCGALTELPAAMGKMECLEKLEIAGMSSVRHIGREFYGVGIGGSSSFVAFPKLKSLLFRNMVEWDDWDLPISKDINVMPQLLELNLENCFKLRKLPALGRLQSLQLLSIENLKAVKRIGSEFCGVGSIDSSDSGGEVITAAFPKLKKLVFRNMKEWELPISTTTMGDAPQTIMPCPCELQLSGCPVLRALPGLGKLKSLESLLIWRLNAVTLMGGEFLGISDDDDVHNGGCSTEEEGVISSGGGESREWRGSNLPSQKDRVVIMPLLRQLVIRWCYKLQSGLEKERTGASFPMIDHEEITNSLWRRRNSKPQTAYLIHEEAPEGIEMLCIEKLHVVAPPHIDGHLKSGEASDDSGASVAAFNSLSATKQPGESLEEAVRRETWEETGIEVGCVIYHSSQPWPDNIPLNGAVPLLCAENTVYSPVKCSVLSYTVISTSVSKKKKRLNNLVPVIFCALLFIEKLVACGCAAQPQAQPQIDGHLKSGEASDSGASVAVFNSLPIPCLIQVEMALEVMSVTIGE
ncbi:hypothetical protein IFM89_006786 [Coptis chinensis]|uniref:Nudix hydrolase domain-containing protein n=1 Tax=Coptis chinensis TaxID=261450 RepID=A0A835IBG6_9MAGN|nr:hypothetical protein IFM89_006786 [Coptis chinensis]